jgi:regulator of protease activity HflC (stomatin/prohibitin superfamily)
MHNRDRKEEINKGLPPTEKFVNELPDELKEYIRTVKTQELPYVKYRWWEKLGRAIVMLSPFGWLQDLSRNYVIQEDQVGLIWENSKPKILPPGRHVLLSPFTRMEKIVNITEPHIQHGPIQIINVSEGQLVSIKDSKTGKIELLSAGQHFIYSNTITFQKFIDLNIECNDLGPLKLVRIETGKVGIVYDAQGSLVILQPGLRLISPPNRFKCIESTQQQILELPQITFKAGDNVSLTIKADVFYTVKKPELTFKVVENVFQFVKDLAIATLGSIIQNSTLRDAGQTSKRSYAKIKFDQKNVSDNEVKTDSSKPSKTFSSKVHDDFLAQLQSHTVSEYGIDVSNIRIETLNIADEKLAQQLSQQAIVSAKTDADLANIDAQNTVRFQTVQAEAEQMKVSAMGRAAALTLEAEAQARATITKAEADSRARELVGTGEAKAQQALNNVKLAYTSQMQSTENGKEILLTEAQANALSKATTIYAPSSAPILSRLGLFPLDVSSVNSNVCDDGPKKKFACCDK